MDLLGISGIPAIAIICYLLGMALKAWNVWDDRKIPVMMGIFGLCLGLAAFIWWPAVIPADDPIMAAAVGIVSGLTATGINQIWKQARKESEDEVQ